MGEPAKKREARKKKALKEKKESEVLRDKLAEQGGKRKGAGAAAAAAADAGDTNDLAMQILGRRQDAFADIIAKYSQSEGKSGKKSKKN